jgi:hypothetical protein
MLFRVEMAAAETRASPPNVIIETGGASQADLDLALYAAWDEFQANHPAVANNLRRNPRLAGSSEYLDRNPELQELFTSNPELHQDLLENPGNYLALGQAKLPM